MEIKNKITAAEIMPRFKSITLTDDQVVKHGMIAWATFEGNIVSDTEFHKLLAALFDLVKHSLSDTEDISLNYRFCENRIIVMGGESRWIESHGKEVGEQDEKWLEFLMDMEVADLPETSNFADFMRKLMEKNGREDCFAPVSMRVSKPEEKKTPLQAPMELDMDNNPIEGLIFVQFLPSGMSIDFSGKNIVQNIGDRSIKYIYSGTLSFYNEKFKDLKIRVSGTFTDEFMEKLNENGMQNFLYQVGCRMKNAGIDNIVLLKDNSSGSPSINPETLCLSSLGVHITKLEDYMNAEASS